MSSKNTNENNFKIGTRKSLLALTQSQLILEKFPHPVDIVKIETEGDQKTDKPLWQMEGKDFFTKELDQALLKNEIDFVIHSYKDLGSERPEGIELAAITQRNYPQDILLIKNDTIAKLAQKKQIIIGSSSPRRIFHIENKLKPYIPCHPDAEIQSKVLRGNVNTRIKKLNDGEYDAIILALAGLERLSQNEDSREVLLGLMKDLNFMVLPCSAFPPAASQGALGIEFAPGLQKDEDRKSKLREALKTLEDQDTIEEVSRERKAFLNYGGGCHLAVGIHVKKHDELFIHRHSGILDNKIIDKTGIERVQKLPPAPQKKFIGMPVEKVSQPNEETVYDELIIKKPYTPNPLPTSGHFFLTSSYGLDILNEVDHIESLWVSGAKTWKNAVQKGYWVNGSADSLGHDELIKLVDSPFCQLKLANLSKKYTLTHASSTSLWGKVIGCYDRDIQKPKTDFINRLLSCDAFYWTSFSQYELYAKNFPQLKNLDAYHCCGLGKTYKVFKENGINIIAFARKIDFQNWI